MPIPSLAKPPVPLATPPVVPARPVPSAPSSAPTEKFSIGSLGGENEGRKIILYGPSGIGKTTLAALAPNAIFLAADDGGRKIKNAITGEGLRGKRMNSFVELRDALQQPDAFPADSTVVIDSLTAVQKQGELYTFQKVKVNGQTVSSIEDYGYGKGYRFLCDTMRLVQPPIDALVRRGINVVMLAQEAPHRVANLEGNDYLRNGPELDNHGTPNVLGEFWQWADDVLRITYQSLNVRLASDKATKGKVTGGDASHVIQTSGDFHFIAKNRCNGELPGMISFSEPKDDSLWRYLFASRYAA